MLVVLLRLLLHYFLLRDLTQRRDSNTDTAIDPWTRIAHRPQDLLAHALADAQALAFGPAIQVRCLECGAVEPASPRAQATLAALVARRLGY